jgi:hypothetical protein
MGKRKKKLSRFIALLWEIVDSPAWESLANSSRVAYIHLKRKITKPNPGEISLSYGEMEKIMNRHTFSKALRELEAIGFITKKQHGGLFRRRNFFQLSEDWRKFSSAKSGTVTSAKNGTVQRLENPDKC